jgi:chromosome partitioning protein
MAKPIKPKTCPVVAVLNMKGGVGKTTISGNVFREIFRRKLKRILLIDFDPQFNLTQLLLSRATYESLKSKKKTPWHVMEPSYSPNVFRVSEKDTLNVSDVSTFVTKLRHITGRPEIVLDLLPGDFELAMLNLRENTASLAAARTRFSSCVSNARTSYDLIVLDCNPSSSFLTRTAIELASHILIPVRPDKYSLLGVEMIFDYIKQLPTVSDMPELLVLLNDIAREDLNNEVVSTLRASSDFGPITLVKHIRRSKVLIARSDHTGFAVDRRAPHTSKVSLNLGEVADELAGKLGL